MESNMMETPCSRPTASRPRAAPTPPPTTTSCAAPSPHPRQLARAARDREIAEAAGVTPTELHHLFRRWAGLTPKAFLQALTLDSARALLRDSASVLDASYEVGCPARAGCTICSSPTRRCRRANGRPAARADDLVRLPSLAVRHRAGDGDRARACGLAFADPARSRPRSPTCAPLAEGELRRGPRRTAPLAPRIFDKKLWRADQPLRVVLIGTDFEVRVWETLLRIPMGRATTYSTSPAISERQRQRGRSAPPWARTRSASGAVPRVIGKSGNLTAITGPSPAKCAMLGWERARSAGVLSSGRRSWQIDLRAPQNRPHVGPTLQGGPCSSERS
jgi:AraC family transcriptional regulator of adaptative response/methylated-DNA-[protein]-cysteine methyltransferase